MPAALRHPARAPEHVAIPLFPATQSDTHAEPLAFPDEVEQDEDERCSSFTTEQRGGGYYEEARGEEGDRESATASWPLCRTTPSSALPSSRRRQRLRARKRLQHLCALCERDRKREGKKDARSFSQLSSPCENSYAAPSPPWSASECWLWSMTWTRRVLKLCSRIFDSSGSSTLRAWDGRRQRGEGGEAREPKDGGRGTHRRRRRRSERAHV